MESRKRMNVVITGASGMVGGIILQRCLESEEVNRVVVITRRSLQVDHPKYQEVIHDDFLNCDPIANHLIDCDTCYFCIGVYTGQVPTKKFNEITIDYTREFSQVLYAQSPKSTFVFLSGQGADSTEKSRVLFARAKGIAENQLRQLCFGALHIFRPGYIYPVTQRKEPNLTYRIFRSLYKPISAIYPNIGLTSEQLAQRMFEVGIHGSEMEIFENADIRK